MSADHYVVIGSGPAGHQAACTLRENAGAGARITLIGEHPDGCYRPHLLPDLICGRIKEKSLYISHLSEYFKKGIKLRTGQRVKTVDPLGRTLTLEHKEVIAFTGAIIAVGGRPRIPEPFLAFIDLLHTLKTMQDARDWMHRLEGASDVLVIGGDLTSLAFTRALLRLNKRVFFLLNEDAFWPLRCGPEVFRETGDRLRERGVEVIEGSVIRSMARIPGGALEVCMDRRRMEVGLIGAFFGLMPDVRFLSGSGLRIDRGVLVDEYLNTGFEGVYAAGDCAQVYHPGIRDYWVSIGHDNAVNLGRIAALNLIGSRIPTQVGAAGIFDLGGVKANTSWWTEF